VDVPLIEGTLEEFRTQIGLFLRHMRLFLCLWQASPYRKLAN